MNLPVYHHDRVIEALEAHYVWRTRNRSLDEAERWINEFADAIEALRENARTHGKAAESSLFPFEVRELLFGLSAEPTHRALYTIRPEMVFVFMIRHVSQRPISVDDLD